MFDKGLKVGTSAIMFLAVKLGLLIFKEILGLSKLFPFEITFSIIFSFP